MFQEGVCPKKINELALSAGFAVGTSTLIDEVGVDIAHHAAVNIGCNPLYGERMNGGDPDVSKIFKLPLTYIKNVRSVYCMS